MLYNQICKKNTPLFFGHRGAPYLEPENSIRSIYKSIEMGSHGVEMDIQITEDNHIILFHDDFIDFRGKQYFINKISYKKVVELCKNTNTHQPDLFKELIPIINKYSNIIFNIEIKSTQLNNDKILNYILNKISINTLQNQCILSSFNYYLLYQLRFLFLYKGPIAPILSSQHLKLGLTINKLIILLLNPDFLHININNTTQKLVDWVHSKSKRINVYTVNDIPTLHKCLELNIDGIFTDNHALYHSKM
tara:strand:- start:67 stop:813 length:747 start_codon:yes stop_codon:yes gene_type:complete